MKTADLIKQLEKKVGDQSGGLPFGIFFVCQSINAIDKC